MTIEESILKFGLPGLLVVLSAGALGAIIKLIQRNGCLLAIRSCCSTEDPCFTLNCNKGRPGEKPTVTVHAEDSL